MQQLSHDERMRHLQQLAYGAVASDAERAAAAAELETLRRERDVPEAPADVPRRGPMEGGGSTGLQPATSAHAARVDGGKNVCVTLAMPEAGTSSSCTSEGRFPESGLWVEFYVEGAGLLRAPPHADGSASITLPGSAVPAMPIAT